MTDFWNRVLQLIVGLVITAGVPLMVAGMWNTSMEMRDLRQAVGRLERATLSAMDQDAAQQKQLNEMFVKLTEINAFAIGNNERIRDNAAANKSFDERLRKVEAAIKKVHNE